MSKSCQRQGETLRFLLSKRTPEHGVIFREVSESTMQPGDIVLFPLDSSAGVSVLFKHAAVCCGDGEVIHFQGTTGWKSSGWISKEGFQAMKQRKGKCKIYRVTKRIDLDDFYSRVKEVMNCEAKYHWSTNNCIHFALYLLGLVDFYKQLVEIPTGDDHEMSPISLSDSLLRDAA